MDDLLNNLINTLNLLGFPIEQDGFGPDEMIIQEKLEELEGDYYTFFHESNTELLLQNGYISKNTFDAVRLIRGKINNLDTLLWNPRDFINDKQWSDIRKLAIEALQFK